MNASFYNSISHGMTQTCKATFSSVMQFQGDFAGILSKTRSPSVKFFGIEDRHGKALHYKV